MGPKLQVHSTAHNGVVFPRGTVTGADLGASLFSGERYGAQRKSGLCEPTRRNRRLFFSALSKYLNLCIQFYFIYWWKKQLVCSENYLIKKKSYFNFHLLMNSFTVYSLRSLIIKYPLHVLAKVMQKDQHIFFIMY